MRHDQSDEELQPASAGVGPLLERDYWAVIDGCRPSCGEVISLLRQQFEHFPPTELAVFRRQEQTDRPLEVGDELEVAIRVSGTTRVRVVHVDANSLTVGTKKGHPEAGRITFGAYPNERADVIFHIRSRARFGSRMHYTGFLAAGDAMQTSMWTDFVDCLAHTVGKGVIGAIHVSKRTIESEREVAQRTPTFIAKGDV